MITKIIISAVYLCVVFYLGYRGWKETNEACDYMLAGRKMNPFVMAMSYGATFISTSAIIGFGGVAGLFGFPLLWLTFLTIFVGIFLAMVFMGKRTRRMGLALDCHTFPEFLGRRYSSRLIQGFAAIIIFLFIPVYAAAVLIGICRMIEVGLGVNYDMALIGFTLVLALYVITGGLKAVMYTDALQGSIMFFMMLILIVMTYAKLGGVIDGHQALTDMAPMMPENLQKGGILGWTQGAKFFSPIGLTIYTTIVYGVGIGVLAQPQLAVRYMTVNSDRQINRAVLYGGVFILLMTGVAFTVGALSNAVFQQEFGQISIAMAEGNVDKIIPMYIETIMPDWFSALFLLAMFAAAMSTLSSQYHVGGTSLGRDLVEQAVQNKKVCESFKLSQVGVAITIVLTLLWAWVLPGSVIARATAFFFGLCAASFLPAYLLGLYWKGMTRAGATVSVLLGFAASMFWLIFVHEKEAKAIGLCELLTGKATLVADATPMSFAFLLQWVDPNVVALPISFVLAVVVSLATKRFTDEHLAHCFKHIH